MPDGARTASTRLLAVLIAGLGIALVVRTLTAGGGVLSTGVVLGIAFILVGAGRLYLTRESR